MKGSILVSLFVLILTISNISSLYFHLYKGEKRCFFDEYYGEVVVVLRYEINEHFTFAPQNDVNKLELTVFHEDSSNIEHTFHGTKQKGKFSFHVDEHGKFQFCIYSNYEPWFHKDDKFKMSFFIDTDQDDVEEADKVPKNKDFADVDAKVKRLNQKTKEIVQMQEYQIKSEDEFSESQISNSNRLVTMTLVQIGIIVLIGAWQIFSLRKFFTNKKYSF